MWRLRPFWRLRPVEPRRQLVRLMVLEKNLHRLIGRVAAERPLLREAVALYEEGETAGHLLYGRLQLIVRVLNLVPQAQSYYDILGVSPGAGREEIKRAFRRASLASHPDLNPADPSAADRFRTIHQAYAILSHKGLRGRYDRHLAQVSWPEPAESPPLQSGSGLERRRYLWRLSLLLSILVALSVLFDFRSCQSDLYYRSRERFVAGDSARPAGPGEKRPPASPNPGT